MFGTNTFLGKYNKLTVYSQCFQVRLVGLAQVAPEVSLVHQDLKVQLGQLDLEVKVVSVERQEAQESLDLLDPQEPLVPLVLLVHLGLQGHLDLLDHPDQLDLLGLQVPEETEESLALQDPLENLAAQVSELLC